MIGERIYLFLLKFSLSCLLCLSVSRRKEFPESEVVRRWRAGIEWIARDEVSSGEIYEHPLRGERESFASAVYVHFGEVPPRKGSVMIGKGGFTRYFKLGHPPTFPSPPPSLDPDDSSFRKFGQVSLDRRPFNATSFRVYPRRQFIRRKEGD